MADRDINQEQPALPNTSDNHFRKRRSCCCGFLSLLWKVALVLFVAIGLAIFVFVIVVNPHKMKFHITDATLKEFNLTVTDTSTAGKRNVTLRSDLRLNFTVRNPNKKIGFHYKVLTSKAFYTGEEFNSGNLLSFYQPRKTTRISEASYGGAVTEIWLGKDEIARFDEQKKSGFYPFVVKIRIFSSITLGKMNIGDFKVKVKCGFEVPLKQSNASSSSSDVFKTTKCHVDFIPFPVIYSE